MTLSTISRARSSERTSSSGGGETRHARRFPFSTDDEGRTGTGRECPERSSPEAAQDIDADLLRGKRVVIVEDEGVTQMQLRRALSRAGLDVIGSAPNGLEGVNMVLAQRPDLVLMDIRMPVMDGMEALTSIMEELSVCVVMLTAFADESSRQQARDKGASGYVVKPVTGEILLPQLVKAYAAFQRRADEKGFGGS